MFLLAWCLWLLYLILGSLPIVFACVAFTSSSMSSVALTDSVSSLWHMIMLEIFMFETFWEDYAFNPRGQRLTASPAWQAIHCTMHRGQPPLDRHQPGDSCRDLWLLPHRGGKLIWSVSSPSGGAPDRSAPVQVCCGQASRCGGATGTPGPVDCPPGDGYPPYNAL